MERRVVLLGGLLSVVEIGIGCSCHAAEAATVLVSGCVLPPDAANSIFDRTASEERLFISGNEPIIPKSGNKNFDFALAQTLAKIGKLFDVYPGFAYYDDYDSLNAYATPKVRMSKADGTVLFGERLLKTLMSSQESPEVAVAAVCAHEFGHVLQFKHGLIQKVNAGQSTVKRSELQADFFAGYFAGRRKLEKADFPAAVVAKTQFRFGDNNFSDPGHHGTPAERGHAIEQGFLCAYREKRPLTEAIATSISYVMSI